jgi:micrococcal nuclease
LVLVDAPERSEPEGPASTARLKQLCPVGSTAELDVDDRQVRDRYGRLVAVVTCGGINVNEAMIRDGYAELYDDYCSRSEFGDDAWAITAGC